MVRRGIRILAGLSVVVAMLLVVAGVVLSRLDLGPLAGDVAGRMLGRPVSIASLRVTPGRWVHVELSGVQVANVKGGTRPTMVGLGRASAEVDLWSLMRGPVSVRSVAIDDLSVFLEHAGDGTPNWRVGGRKWPSDGPAGRSGFPGLLKAELHRAELVFRTTHGNLLRMRLDRALLESDGDDQPMRLHGEGAYNDTKLAVEGTLDPVAKLRDAQLPYGVRLRFAAGEETVLEFSGTMTRPFDADGASGDLKLRAGNMKALIQLAGAQLAVDAAVELGGKAKHDGDVWRIADAAGSVSGAPLGVKMMELQEGPAGGADAVRLDLTLAKLDLDQMLPGNGGGSSALPDIVSANPDPVLNVTLALGEVVYGGQSVAGLMFAGSMLPSRTAVPLVSLSALGGRIEGDGQAVLDGEGAHLAARLEVDRSDLNEVRKAVGARSLPVSGHLDARVVVTGEAATWDGAVKDARIAAVLSMQDGWVARDDLEKASTDVRTLFRRAHGVSALTCLLGVVRLSGGAGTVMPLRLRSADGTVVGSGSFDLRSGSVDVVIGSEGRTTSFFALDVPVRIAGPVASPSIRPAEITRAGRARLAAVDDIASLPSELSRFAAGNACYPGRR